MALTNISGDRGISLRHNRRVLQFLMLNWSSFRRLNHVCHDEKTTIDRGSGNKTSVIVKL